MKRLKFLPLFFGLVGESWGQQSASQAAIEPAPPTQQRADLRSVLKTASVQVAQDKSPDAQSRSDKRHLTPQERADLRKQLRQQYQEAKLERQ